jgi:hypothetical protein
MKQRLLIIIICLTFYGCLSDRGLIRLQTIPSAATVYRNGINIGQTPVEFEHDYERIDNVTLEKEGFETLNEVIGKKWIRKEARISDSYQEGDFLVNGKMRHVWKITTTRTLKKEQ